MSGDMRGFSLSGKTDGEALMRRERSVIWERVESE